MKKQNTAVRRAALAVLYLAVFAAAVMYLRVTISVPAEGDDKLTLNGWLYDMGRMSFWQYALQDLKERLSFFLLKQVRFFPFHYPNAVALLFYRTLASYRLYIIAMTGAAAFLVSRVAAKLSRSNALALGAFGLALAAAPIFNEGMYSYYAVPQRTLLWAAASWLCLFYLHESHHHAWGVAAAVLGFSLWSGLFFIHSIVTPLHQVERVAHEIAQGSLDARLPDQGRDDEIGRLCGAINRMAQDLSKTEQMKNEFLSSVSHELRTPLTSIKGWVETIGNIDDPTDKNYQRGLSVIGTETDRLYTMVEELLDFSRLQNGIKLNCQVLDLVAEATDAALFVEARIRQEGLHFVYAEPPDPYPVWADPARLHQVFINILDNAIKYSAPGGRITVKLWAGEYKAFIELIDQGRGIPPEDLENVKTKFYKGSNSVRGSGIGLALVDSIMTALDGTMDIKSTLGRGTVVTLGLPLYKK